MASKLCCTSDDRSGSPDAPNARHPVIEPRRHLLFRSTAESGSCRDTATTGCSESQDLSDLVALTHHSEDCLNDVPANQNTKSAYGAVVKSSSGDSLFFNRIKARLSRDSGQLKSNPQPETDISTPSQGFKCDDVKNEPKVRGSSKSSLANASKALAVRQAKRHFAKKLPSLDLLSDRTPSKGGYDCDAPMINGNLCLRDVLEQETVQDHCEVSEPGEYPTNHLGIDDSQITGESTIIHHSTKTIPASVPGLARLFRSEHPNTPKTSFDALGTSLSSEVSPSSLTRSEFCVQVPPIPNSLPPKLPSLNNLGNPFAANCAFKPHSNDCDRPDPLENSNTSVAADAGTSILHSGEKRLQEGSNFSSDPSTQNKVSISPKKSQSVPSANQETNEKTRHDAVLRGSKTAGKNKLAGALPPAQNDETYTGSQSDESANADSADTSVHLQDMRISQHLRSFSDATIESSDGSFPEHHEKSVNRSCNSISTGQTNGIHRKSSSGFQSVKVPPAWGKVIDKENRALRSSRASGSASTEDEGSLRPLAVTRPKDGEGLCNPVEQRNIAHPSIASVLQGNNTSNTKSSTELSAANVAPRVRFESVTLRSGNGKSDRLSLTLQKSGYEHTSLGKFQKENPQSMDGPADMQLAPPEPSKKGSVSVLSMGSNYEEAAALWEKAFLAHQEQRDESSRTRTSSISSLFHAGYPGERRLSSTSNDDRERRKSDAYRREDQIGSQSVQLKSLNVEHTFDRLLLPGRASVSQPSSPVIAAQKSQSLAEPEWNGQRRRASSQPNSAENISVPFPQTVEPLDALVDASGVICTPDITVTDTTESRRSRQRSGPKLVFSKYEQHAGAWGKYPSHTRSDRVLSAGIEDGVIAQDFAPVVNVTEDEDSDQSLKAKRDRKRKKKARSMMLRKMIFMDLPSLFKSRSAGYRQGEMGHRSSIAVGGVLEYPELELLPPPQPFVGPVKAQSARQSSSVRSGKSTSAKSQSSGEDSAGKQQHVSMIGSSNYGSAEDHSMALSDSHGSRACANDYSAFYSQEMGKSERRNSDTVSPLEDLDGSANQKELSKIRSTSLQSSPVGFVRGAGIKCSGDVRKALSAEVMRTSSQDLYNMLKNDEEKERLKALRAAEEVWKA